MDHWLGTKGFKLEKDARERRLLQLSVVKDALMLEAKGRLRGFLLNDSLKLEKVSTIRIEWGIIQYPQDVSYARKVNNEALMLYVFFGKERVSSGSVFIPDSPYFIGLFLCDDGQVNFPYKGQYFHTGGRFVCLGQPKPNETIVSEFDLERRVQEVLRQEEVGYVPLAEVGAEFLFQVVAECRSKVQMSRWPQSRNVPSKPAPVLPMAFYVPPSTERSIKRP